MNPPLDDQEVANPDRIRQALRPNDAGPAAAILRKLSDTLLKKNQDYGSSYVKIGEMMAVMFPQGTNVKDAVGQSEIFMLTRILDKLNRVCNLRLGNQIRTAVVDESVEDTLMDIAGYCSLWAAMVTEKTDPSAYRMM